VPRFWRRGALRRALEKCSAVSFCARAQAEPFRGAGLLGPQVEVFEIPESTSSFKPGDQAAARAATGIHGDPAVLWVGHLNANKDPLTILDAVSIARRRCRVCSCGAASGRRRSARRLKRASRPNRAWASACTCSAVCRTSRSNC
jgi:hypothetical protein